MTDKELEYKLVLLIEECSEVIQAATKCLRFGAEKTFAEYGKNIDVLAQECGDVLGVMDQLPLNKPIMEGARANKWARVQYHKGGSGG